MHRGRRNLRQGMTSGNQLVFETWFLPKVLSLPPLSFCCSAWEARSESSLHSSDYTGRHCTEDFIRWKEKEKKKRKEKARTLAEGRKALLPLDKGENYFISVWSSKACERWIWHSSPRLIFSLQHLRFWVSSCSLQCDRSLALSSSLLGWCSPKRSSSLL